ncbi:hypothetical protein CA13_45150 [Planctomycetes bacterium CA13]|uniref:DUF2306 domain-containing protein n=2 Tax=Novipirellula herctigrandis TaxID=2527986 RepID=A0A5C5Z6U9_9BACT|nr:hypothetical protein CA13_45150 [Planctomycetes bacterium CA13]
MVAMAVLLVKGLIGILMEYRWYFPADYDASAFLSGRRYTFFGTYRTAFYVHILSGPIVVVLGTLLMLSGGRKRFAKQHRRLGKSLLVIIIAVMLPSGLIIARMAYAGPIAAVGFVFLTVATAVGVSVTAYYARARKFQLHQRWASRSFVLLISPLVLRLISGVAIVTQTESEALYRANAWVSWLIPLAIYEMVWRWKRGGSKKVANRSDPRQT